MFVVAVQGRCIDITVKCVYVQDDCDEIAERIILDSTALSAGQLPREMYSRLMPSTNGVCERY